MDKMKKVALALLATVAIVSCTNENHEPQPQMKPKKEAPTPKPDVTPNPNTPRPTPPPTPEPQATEISYISKIEQIDPVRDSKISEINYNYDTEKRLIGFNEHKFIDNQILTGTINYEKNRITIEYDENKYHSNLAKPTIYRLIRNDHGIPQSTEEVITFKAGEQERLEIDMSFDKEGNCLGYSTAFFRTIQSTWQNGNMTKTVYKRDYTVTEDRKYSNIPNNIYPDLNMYMHAMPFTSELRYLLSQELGTRSKYLLESVSYDSDKFANSAATYKYSLDTKGRPKSITWQGGNGKYLLKISYLEN